MRQRQGVGPVLSQGQLTTLGCMHMDSEKVMAPPLRACQGLLKNVRDRALGQKKKKELNIICNMASNTVPGWFTGLLEIAGSDFVKGRKV